MKKIAIIGSRDFRSADKVRQLVAVLANNYRNDVWQIVSGGAKGVDTIAVQEAYKWDAPVHIFLPDYRKYAENPKYAPIARNYQIVDYSDEVHAFWNGVSKGTEMVIRYAKEQDKPCYVYYED